MPPGLAPRASGSAARLARPPLQPPTPSAGAANSPARANWHPMPPSPSPSVGPEAPPAAPSPRG
ncbi:uncharacterized protein N7487_007084 [Penicillium crustosum]|uniref:uncharacterized protein n=1 Tax=Penicillium crustosum TaxID=36656 RepID=UPI00238379A4|nr:uncharacterized protein N7487_007084 [Penicillium crustosum]KAJ5401188.1 hypothetical protein N7487_007084 [Penicillium crustosum]